MKRIPFILILYAVLMYSPHYASAQGLGNSVFWEEGIASWYSPELEGRPTSSGEIYNPALFTAAHPTLPFGTSVIVKNKLNNKEVTVRINDRGPHVSGRIIDVSKVAAQELDMLTIGTAPVIIQTAGSVAAQQPQVGLSQAEYRPPPPPPPPEPIPPAPIPAAPIQRYSRAELIPTNSTRLPPLPEKRYRLQVGAFSVPRFAVIAFETLKNAGLNPRYEREQREPSGELYKVVLPFINGYEVDSIAERLGSLGFKEALIREDP